MPTSEFVHQITPDIVAEQIDRLDCIFSEAITERVPCVDFDCVRPHRPARQGGRSPTRVSRRG